jgi:hypothetical protein
MNMKESNSRVKAAYNLGKSLLLLSTVKQNDKILDLGCKSGTEMLKFAHHRPSCVVFIDKSESCLQRVKQFAESKKIRYPFGMLQVNFYQDKWASEMLLVRNPKLDTSTIMGCNQCNVITSFSTIEYCTSEAGLHLICSEITQALVPGGFWIGCMTNGDKLLKRCDKNGFYQDNYCQIQLKESTGEYTFQTHGKDSESQFILSVATLCRIALHHNLHLVDTKSILDLIGDASMDRNYKRLCHASQMNGKNKLHLDDMRPLSLLEMFVFQKPFSECRD